MHRHRIAPETDAYRLPLPPAPAPAPGSFVLWPLAGPAAVQHLYQLAFERAQAVARPSVLQRDLLAAWN
jgi:hypothetical protein